MRGPLVVERLVSEGRFKEALRIIGAPLPTEPMLAAARASLLLHTGKALEAVRLATRLVRTAGESHSLAAACHMVLGGACRHSGDLAQACQHFQRSIASAEQQNDWNQACWAQLRLMSTIAEAYGDDTAFAVLPDVRKQVARAGDPHATCALHVYVAEIETKRGHFDNASRHLRTAESLLRLKPNAWLEGLVAVASLCLAYLRSDVSEALRQAHRALQLAATSGDAITEMAAVTNLGHVFLLFADLKRAETWLRRAERGWTEGGGARIAILDGLAQVYLAAEDVGKCEETLDRIEFDPYHADEPTYYEACALLTRVRLLLRKRLVDDAAKLAARGLQIAERRGGPTLVGALRLLAAECELGNGSARQAINLTPVGADWAEEAVSGSTPKAGRTIARIHGAAGAPSEAVDWFERSARLFASACDECGRAEVLDDYADFLWQGTGAVDRTRGRRRDTCPPAQRKPATHLTYHPHAATLVGRAPRPESSAFSALHQATTLLDLRSRPYAMALETFELLQRLPGVRTCAVVCRADERPPDIIRAAGDYAAAESMLAEDATPERVRIGRWREADLEVLVDTADDIAARSAVAAVKRLLGAGAALEKAEQEQRERAALWPIEDAAATAGGVFASRSMTELLATARRVASTNATVLVTGESGAGKEVIARAIHDASPRAQQVFVPFNCTAVPRDMLDSQLFGYRRGAFTGAETHFPGVIRSAAGGTLLLDEIGEIGLELQPKLLRFLDTNEIQPLGEPKPTRVDVRVIAATNAKLEDLVAAGRFREDLYYRLNVVPLRVPPLRERREEIPVLAHHFLERFADEYRKENLRLSEECVEYLILYSWPGNVRELLNQMRRLAALAENGAVLMPEHLAPEITAARRTVPASERTLSASELVVRLDQPLAAAVQHLERAMVPYAVEAARGHMEVAARMLGLSRKGLYLKRQRLGLEIGDAMGGRADEA